MLRRWKAATTAAALAGVLTFSLSAPSAHAQDGDKEDKTVRLTSKEGGWKITELFQSIYGATGRSILYDPKAQQINSAKVEFVGDAIIKESKLFEWLQAVLAHHNLVLIPVGPKGPNGEQQWFAIDSAKPALQSRPRYVEEEDLEAFADRDGLYVVTSIKLKHISDTTRVRSALSQLSTRTANVGKVVDIQGSRSLIVADFAPMAAAIYRLIQYIDTPNEAIDPEMEVIRLNYAVASELEPIISDLIEGDTTVGPQNNRNPRNRNTSVDEPEPKIIADDRLDALIVYATRSYRDKIKQLVDKLDIPSDVRTRLNFVPLKHTDAESIAGLLEELISGISDSTSGGSTTGRNNRPGGRNPRPAGTTTGAAPLGSNLSDGDPVIIADDNSNSLIIYASPTQYTGIKDLIEKLDQSRPQVLIETALVELALTDNLQVATELFRAGDEIAVDADGDGVLDTLTKATNGFTKSGFGLGENILGDVGGVSVPLNQSPLFGTGLTAGIFKNGKLPLIVSLFQSTGRSKIVTMPSVVANDNQEATLELVRQTSFRESTRTDSGTDRDTFNTVEATTTLTISPSISSDNYLRLEIDQSVESFGNRPSPDAPPDSTTRRIKTNVTVPDKATVVLGGLIQEEERSVVEKVPFLGDLPVFGFFFRSSTDDSTPQHLFLFVTPTILRDTTHFKDYVSLTKKKKLILDDLIGEKVELIGTNFDGRPADLSSAADRIRILEESGELDGGRPPADVDPDEAKKAAEEKLGRKMNDGSSDGAPRKPAGSSDAPPKPVESPK